MIKKSTLALLLVQLILLLNEIQGQTICETLAPCYSGSTCVATGTTYECKCPYGYADRKCDRQLMYSTCSYVKCDGYCTTPYYQIGQFWCIPSSRLESYIQYTSAYRPGVIDKNCPVPSPCQNGGQCYTYWANAQTQLYSCLCPKGFGGVNCETQGSFGLQPIGTSAWPRQIYYEYQGLESFNQNFLLLNTEIKADMTINKIEYTLTRGGTFKIGFVKFPNCGADGQISCADMVFNEYIQGGNSFSYSNLIANALVNGVTITDYSVSSGSWDSLYTSTYSNMWIPVVKGTLLVLTQVDAFVAGTPLSTAPYSDAFIFNTTNQQFSLDSIEYSPLNWAFTLLVSDTTRGGLSQATNPSSYCGNSLCQNGGTCMQVGYSYSCICPSYTSGQYCEFNSQSTTSRRPISSSNNNGNTNSNNNNNGPSTNSNNNNNNNDPCSSNPCPAQQTCETIYSSATHTYSYTCQSQGSSSNNDGGLAHYLNFFFSIFDINNFH